jgi:HKD family nuclease
MNEFHQNLKNSSRESNGVILVNFEWNWLMSSLLIGTIHYGYCFFLESRLMPGAKIP